MKPKPIMAMQDTLSFKKVKIETPMGSLESDSGNHLIDVTSIIIVIGVLYIGKKIIDKYVK